MIAGFELGHDAALLFDMPLQLADAVHRVCKKTFEQGPVHANLKRRGWLMFKRDCRQFCRVKRFRRRGIAGMPAVRARLPTLGSEKSEAALMAAKRKNWHAAHAAELTFGARIADAVAATMGSWTFIIAQSVVLALWIVVNVAAWVNHWDPYPFILLNLALSFQAAYAAPFIMISQNRQAERDRLQAEADYRTNFEAEQRIEDLQRRLAAIELNKLDYIIRILEKHMPAEQKGS